MFHKEKCLKINIYCFQYIFVVKSHKEESLPNMALPLRVLLFKVQDIYKAMKYGNRQYDISVVF